MSTTQQYVSYAFARDNSILLKPHSDREAEVWITEATGLEALHEVMRAYPGRIRPSLVEAQALSEAIAQTYSRPEDSAQQIVGDIEGEMDITRMMQDVPDIEDLLETDDSELAKQAQEASVVKLVNEILIEAANEHASDIHIEPEETALRIRYRIDGLLQTQNLPPEINQFQPAIISRIKIMARLNIAEKRLPQDGRITLRVGGRAIDVRVSTLPTGHGERVVLRLLEKDLTRIDLTNLGMSDRTLALFDQLFHQPHGILLVTGPTGSGKSTTLYAAIRRLDHTTSNIMTVEDPIEYELPGVGQTQVNAKIEMSFARALRSILRQDPDVIMIGEIRDLETAQIAVQASLTGHLVLATLHTNDAASAVTRLIDMGIEPFLLSSSLLGVLAQRLVRKLCPHCKKKDASGRGFTPVGCPQCNHTGYMGRTGIYELLSVDDTIRGLIHSAANDQEIRRTAEAAGMLPLRADAMRWYAAGITAQEEILRVTRD